MSSRHCNNELACWRLDDVPRACQFLLISGDFATTQVTATLSLNTRDMSDLFRVKVCLSNQVILDVTEQQAVLSLGVNEVAHTLCVIELRLSKRTLLVTHLTRAYLFDKCVGRCIQHQEPVVGGVSDDDQLRNAVVWKACLVRASTHCDYFTWMAQILPQSFDRLR